jgi:hypothetical protein
MPSKVVEAVMLPTYIQEVSGSKLGQDADCYGRGFSNFPQYLRKCYIRTLN